MILAGLIRKRRCSFQLDVEFRYGAYVRQARRKGEAPPRHKDTKLHQVNSAEKAVQLSFFDRYHDQITGDLKLDLIPHRD